MAYKKRGMYARSRRGRKPRRVPKLGGNHRRNKRLLNAGMFHIKQRVDGSRITAFGGSRIISQTNVDQHIGVEFHANDLPQFASFAAIYDQYRINKIAISFIPMANVNAVGSTATYNCGLIASVIDYDDVTPLGALTDYEQYTNFKASPIVRNKSHTRVFVPRSLTPAVNIGGGLVNSAPKVKQWIDCNSGGVFHTGIKLFIEKYPTVGGAQTFQIIATYYMSFKNVH